MKAYIHDIERERSYLVTCLRDCRTLHDKALYEMVVKVKDVVSMGKYIGVPVK